MTRLKAEARLLIRSHLMVISLSFMLCLSALAVWSGIHQVARQDGTIARVAEAQKADLAAVAAVQGKPDGDPGYAGYYSFLLTHDAPPPLAFAALGQRDIQPYVLRIRALGLQSQLYDAENINPELALPGVFDWAFVVVYLAPLIVIALAHDLVTGEREGGRLRLLLSMPGTGLWRRRIGLRYILVIASLALPFLVGVLVMCAPVVAAGAMPAVAALYVGFWFGLSMLVGSTVRGSATSAAALMGCWIGLTLVLPTLANAVIARAIPTGKGIELTLAQREIVNRGWDIPKSATFDRFLAGHPRWRGKESFEGRFHWKWLYAMHQVGDEVVEPDAAAYRSSLLMRERWTQRTGYGLPGVATQAALHRIADTDLISQFAYQDSIARFHKRIRLFLYPYLFDDRPFTRADFALIPGYVPRGGTGTLPFAPILALCVAAGLTLATGARRIAAVSRAPRA